MKRQAATAVPGGVASGNVERGVQPKQSTPSTSAETDPPSPKPPLPPGMDPNEGVSLKEAKIATVAAGGDTSSIETKTVGEAETTAAMVGQAAKSSVTPKAKEVSSLPQAVVVGRTDNSISATGETVGPVVAVEERATMPAEKKKKKEGVGPETTAAEKVRFCVRLGR